MCSESHRMIEVLLLDYAGARANSADSSDRMPQGHSQSESLFPVAIIVADPH